MKSHKPTYYLVLFATFFALVVIVLGAYTRLKDAGLGCPDWPGCYGFFTVPDTAEEIALAQSLFPETPFEADKAWPEVIHRYVAGILGLLIMGIAYFSWRRRHEREQPVKLPFLLLALVIAQGLFGMWTVTLGLWPQVVTIHLLGGFTTLALLWLLCLRLTNRPWPQPTIPLRYWRKLKLPAAIGLILVVCQITLGGWVSANYAALACPELPTCQGQWWPSMNMAAGFNLFQEIGPNYLGGRLDGEARVAIHMAHRIGALVVILYLGMLIHWLHRYAGGREMARLANIILALLVVQVGLGMSNVVFQLPLWVAVAHNAGGALLLLSLVTLNYRLRRTSAGML